MADIINLQNYIIESKHKRSFNPWKKRFGEDPGFFAGTGIFCMGRMGWIADLLRHMSYSGKK